MAGNATVELYNDGQIVTYDIWMQGINTASDNQFMMQQIHNKVSWIPIRRAEMMLHFTALWPVLTSKPKAGVKPDLGYENIDPTDGFAKMNKFQNAIRKHQLSIATGVTDQAMVVTFKNNSNPANYNTLISTKPLTALVYNGYIQAVDMEYARYKNVFVRNYTMNVLTKNTDNPNINYMQSSTNVSQNISYAPTAASIQSYGNGWVDVQQLANNSRILITGMP